MEKKKSYSTLDALKELDELDAYEAAYRKVAQELQDRRAGKLDESSDDDCITDNYREPTEENQPEVFLDKDGNIVVKHRWASIPESKDSPEVGDVLYLKVPLTHIKNNKKIWQKQNADLF